MQRRKLGNSDLDVSIQGLGCMEIAGWYGARDDVEAVATLDRALELGVNFFDSADVYGAGENEEYLGRWLKGRRDKVILATKFGSTWDEGGRPTGIAGTPDHVRAACDASLARLGIDTIDLYYQHRVDPDVPIEDTVGAMGDLITAGKVRYIGLSEAAPATLRRAAATHTITALQTEFSLLSREPESELIPLCRELGTAFVAYSPIARGLLTDVVPRGEDLPPDDFRSAFPRFLGDNYDRNLGLVDVVKALAKEKGCTTASGNRLGPCQRRRCFPNSGDQAAPLRRGERRCHRRRAHGRRGCPPRRSVAAERGGRNALSRIIDGPDSPLISGRRS